MNSVAERFWSKVEKTDSCWLYTGSNNNGYGQFWTGTKNSLAHRFSYELVAKIPEGLHIDHLCRVRNCVNPEHLEPVTNKENVLRGEGYTAKKARQTHCIRGHELSGKNLAITVKGYRRCNKCNVIRTLKCVRRKRSLNQRLGEEQ